ncbi:MAG: hypothetical protein ABR549_11335 [Mycobacteriales bacterium]
MTGDVVLVTGATTEAVLLHEPQLAETSRTTTQGFATAVAWLLERSVEEAGGLVLTLDELRSRGAVA